MESIRLARFHGVIARSPRTLLFIIAMRAELYTYIYAAFQYVIGVVRFSRGGFIRRMFGGFRKTSLIILVKIFKSDVFKKIY